VEKFIVEVVDLEASFDEGKSDDGGDDGVREYACDVLSLGLLYMNYQDAIREGDGERVMLIWKYLLPIFKVTNRKNYSIEAFLTLAKCKLLPPRQAHQVIWSRFVNTHGNSVGRNIPCDLHNEHLNRLCKVIVQHLGANKTTKAIKTYSKCLGPLYNILTKFDDDTGFHSTSPSHTKASDIQDRDLILKELHENAQVFNYISKRCHPSFPNFHRNPLKKLNGSDFKEMAN
jgi:L1 cell adhesion molecule like protein